MSDDYIAHQAWCAKSDVTRIKMFAASGFSQHPSTDAAGVRLSARNQLAGTIAKVTAGAVNAEVILTLEDGNEVVAIVTNDSVASLGLAAGQRASAVFKASSVIVGVKN